MKSNQTFRDLRVGDRFKIYWNGKTIFKKKSNVNVTTDSSKTEGYPINSFNEISNSYVYCDPKWPVWKI